MLVIFRRSDRWIVVSQVCKHWRDVALSAPALWTHIETSNHEWSREILRRSGTAPLRVRAAWRRNRWTNEAMGDVLTNLDRIQDLELSAQTSSLKYIAGCLPDWNAPSLKSIDFQCINHYGIDFSTGRDYEPQHLLAIYADSATQGLFGELTIPHIQRIRLSHWDYNTISPLLIWPSLRELTLESIQMHSTTALFSALQDLPLLESLTLKYSFDGAHLPVKYAGARNSVSLPTLKKLALIGPMQASLTLFSSLDLSPSARITLDDVGLLHPSFDPHYLASVLATTTYGIRSRFAIDGSPPPPPLQSLRVEVARFEAHIAPQVRITGYRALPSTPGSAGAEAHLEPVLCVAFCGHLFERITFVGDALDLSSVESLDLGGMVHYLPKEFCRRLPRLRTVTYTGSPRMFNSLAMFSEHVVFKWKRP